MKYVKTFSITYQLVFRTCVKAIGGKEIEYHYAKIWTTEYDYARITLRKLHNTILKSENENN